MRRRNFRFCRPEGAPGAEVLNTFAYTCGFSVCAAKAGARTTSLDLSKKYLEWGKRNFRLNQLDPGGHDFIYGDAFDWLRRLTKKGRIFDVVVLDPPTFSQSKEQGAFQAEKDYGRLVKAALPLLKPNGVLFASTNAARLEPEQFLETLASAIETDGRKMLQQHYVPQPPDFPVHRQEPAYLKTVWLKDWIVPETWSEITFRFRLSMRSRLDQTRPRMSVRAPHHQPDQAKRDPAARENGRRQQILSW